MRLILLRHAKSDWDDGALTDRQRPLNARGRRDAPRIGAWIAKHGAPDRALVSAAARTRETWSLLGLPGEPAFREDLYLAPPDKILAVLPGAGCALIVGHNPGIAETAEALVDALPADPDFTRFPTCACAIIDFDGPPDWGAGRLAAFVTPKSL